MSSLPILSTIRSFAMRHQVTSVMPVFVGLLFGSLAQAETCDRTVTANIVAMDQPVLFNRLGASNVNGMIFALERDVIDMVSGLTLNNGGAATPGNVGLRHDKRPRPIVLRVREGDCLTIALTNLLTPSPNPIKPDELGGDPMPGNDQFNVPIDEQVLERNVSFQVAGLEWAAGEQDAASYVGQNSDSTVPQGGMKIYSLYAPEEGVFVARGMASTVGADANQGNSSNLLFGQVIVEPRGARMYRSQTTEEEMRLASMNLDTTDTYNCGLRNLTDDGQPIIDYEANYPTADCANGTSLGTAVWAAEGKAGAPILNMNCNADGVTNGACAENEIIHTDLNAIVAGPDDDGTWKSVCPDNDPFEGPCPYPLESVGKRNPTLPNRLEAFRDFASAYHGEVAAAQAFPGFYIDDPVFSYVLSGVGDAFMINYGSGGIGSEIIANRLGVGPMHDCLSCAFEEFFLTSHAVGDPAQLANISANIGLERVLPGDPPPAGTVGPKATWVPYPDDPANVHHSYTGDFVKIRNSHIGNENHVFHLHNHQWLYNPNDDNSNYIDAQGIGPGSSYTYEINFGGSGNRMKSAGDAIYHCHFYPHFAQGMWYLWRNHDVMETGTPLQVSGALDDFHSEAFALENGTPLLLDPVTGARARALPDGEIVAGAPIPAVIPLPGKPMPPLPGRVHVVPNSLTTTASIFNPTMADLDSIAPGIQVPVGSLAKVVDRDINPGYPFWIAGVEDTIGQRPPTPPLDMATAELVTTLNNSLDDFLVKNSDGVVIAEVRDLFDDLRPAQAGGWNGGLPRSALQGYAAGGLTAVNIVSRLEFTKVLGEAQAVFFPEEGTDIEQVAMAYHAVRKHPTYTVDMNGTVTASSFILNGNRPAVGAPFHEPCMDDQGDRFDSYNDPLSANTGHVFWGGSPNSWSGDTTALSAFDADSPRIYKGVNIQFDAVLNKAGYHYPQQRILTLWEDAVPVITKAKPPEPMVLRFNTFECGVYHHANLVPEYYELDDYQVRTPTDIIGQHIHLPKWDLTTGDGAANGWNYEDGTLSPGAVQERIRAINLYSTHGGIHQAATGAPADTVPGSALVAAPHPFFGGAAPPGTIAEKWLGARTTMQRWFFDPVLNSDGIDRGLGIIFTHDHFGPSTHQQIGLYATVLTEPANSTWAHNETGEQLGCRYPGEDADPAGNCRADGGPTSWQAAIIPDPGGSFLNPPGQLDPFREFYFEYSDFQHAYEAGIYVGADQNGEALDNAGADLPMAVSNIGNPDACSDPQNAFRCSINPPGRAQITPVYPDLIVEATGVTGEVLGCPERPCPMAIDAADPGMLAVNYRNEPIGLRVYDPNRMAPDGKPGMQAQGDAGDLAFALQSRTDRAIPELNVQPIAGTSIHGTIFPPPINTGMVKPGDPFTPMMRTYVGDLVRVKMQAGGDEEEHNATIHGLKWLQSGSGHGSAPNSGWRNNQAGGISEQFTLTTPIVPVKGSTRQAFIDYAYSMDASQDGWWSGMWGLMRAHELPMSDLFELPDTQVPIALANAADFNGVCPATAYVRNFDITAAAANDILPTNLDVTIYDVAPGGHLGNTLDSNGGTLVYNPRTATVGGQVSVDHLTGATIQLPSHQGPIHDPTALLYVHTDDLIAAPYTTEEIEACSRIGLFFFDSPEITTTVVSSRRDRRNRYAYTITYRVDFSNDGDAAYGVTAKVTSTAAGITILDSDVNFGDISAGGSGSSGTDYFKLRWDRRYPFDGGKIEFDFHGDIEGDGDGIRNAACPVKLRNGTKVEPLIMRAAAGDCIDVTLRNRLPAVANELATLATLLGVTKRDRFDVEGSTTFQTNLMRTSSYAGLHPQLVAYDVSRANGILVGENVSGIYNSLSGLARPEDGVERMKWYAGDLAAEKVGGSYILTATPVEFGTSNLQPADVIKQGMKSLVGQLVIEPEGSTWDDEGDDTTGRQSATVTRSDGTTFRDFSLVMTKGQTHYYADSSPVEHANGEGGAGIPEDSQAGSGMAVNYAIEPLWFRLGLLPQSIAGNATAPGSFGATQQYDVYSNSKIGGDPVTPVFVATAGEEVRMRVGVPHGTNRGTVFALHGHVWQRDPYLAEFLELGGYPRSYAAGGSGVGSVSIGQNPLAFYQGGQESIFPTAHYDIVLPSAGGTYARPGDYMYRDVASANVASGQWGILRVLPASPPEPPPEPPPTTP